MSNSLIKWLESNKAETTKKYSGKIVFYLYETEFKIFLEALKIQNDQFKTFEDDLKITLKFINKELEEITNNINNSNYNLIETYSLKDIRQRFNKRKECLNKIDDINCFFKSYNKSDSNSIYIYKDTSDLFKSKLIYYYTQYIKDATNNKVNFNNLIKTKMNLIIKELDQIIDLILKDCIIKCI